MLMNVWLNRQAEQIFFDTLICIVIIAPKMYQQLAKKRSDMKCPMQMLKTLNTFVHNLHTSNE